MTQIYFRHLLERLHDHRAAFARMALDTPAEAATTAVALTAATLGYRTVVLIQPNAHPSTALFASTGLSLEQQARWRGSERFWHSVGEPRVFHTASLARQDARLFAELGLGEAVLAVPFSTALAEPALLDALLVAAWPLAEADPVVDLDLLELLAFQVGTACASSLRQTQLQRALGQPPDRVLHEELPVPSAVLDQLPAVVFQTDRAGRYSWLNQTWTALTGIPVAESVGAYVWAYLHPDDQRQAQQLIDAVLQGGAPVIQAELRLLPRAGTLRWVEMALMPLEHDGVVSGVTGLLTEQTEQHQAEQLQTQRHRFFERLATGASLPDVLEPLVHMLELHYPDGLGSILVCDEAGLIQSQGTSPAQPGLYTYTVTAGLQGPISGRCSIDLRGSAPLVVADVLAEPQWLAYQRAAAAQGLRACWAQPFLDQQGEPLGVVVVYYRQPRTASDAALQPLAEIAQLAASAVERRRDEGSLRDREELFRLISESTTDHIGVLDEHGNYLYASPSLRTSLGYEPTSLVGSSAFALVHPDDLATAAATWAKIDVDGVAESTFRYRTTEGTWRWFDAIGNAVSYRGSRAFISVSRDVTERRLAEQARQRLEAQLAQAQKMESIGTLAGGIAHDFNNILTAILGNVQLALLGLPPESPEYPLLEEIEKASTRAATLTRQLLTFSRYQQHERKAVDLNATISDLLQMFRRLISSTVEIAIDLTPGLPLLVADPVQIEQVVLNLAVNARDAMPGGGRLLIATRTRMLNEDDCRDYPWTRPGPYVQIEVCDSGTGMDSETQQRIFEPFFTTKQLGKGTGLGLAVVYGIIKQYDGFISVASAPGKGSTFTVSLPVQRVVSMPDEPGARPLARGGSETILVVEDEASLRQLATTTLERLGYTVVVAEDGLAAVEIFAADPQRIDLAMLDLIMPRLGGREALAQMRTIRPELRAFFVTGYDSSAERSAAEHTLSAAPVLAKPYQLDTLGLAVRQLLDS